MVCHVYVGVNRYTILARGRTKLTQIEAIVAGVEEAGVSVVATLNDVVGAARNIQSRESGHAAVLARMKTSMEL